MKAVKISEPGSIKVIDVEMPQVERPDDVIVQVKYTGICGSDIGIYQGHNAFVVYPRVFGHEFTGTVYQVGEGVSELKPGDHVVGEPLEYCGECYSCRIGHPNVCENLKVYGVHLDGGGQAFIRMPAKHVYRISDEVPFECAVLSEPMTIGFRSCNRAQLLNGDTVLIQGAGTIGLCALLAAKSRGAKVIITDIFKEKLEYAVSLGADHTINCSESDIIEETLRLTDGKGANVVFDAVGSKKSLEDSLDLASAAGRIVELGMADHASDINHMKLCRRDITLCGTRLQAHEFPEAIRFVEDHWKDKLSGFVTAIYDVDDAAEAFSSTIGNARESRKTLIRF